MQVVLVVAGLRTNSQIQSPMMLGTSYQVVSSKNSIIISVVLCCVWFMTEHLESTATLLNRVKTGDDAAKEKLCGIYLPILCRWAHGRLPGHARDLAATDDLVHTTLINALNQIDNLNHKGEGAFLAYLRKILLNNVRLEIRRNQTKLSHHETVKELYEPSSESMSVVEQAIGAEALERYERALSKLSKQAREAVILKAEFGYTFPEIAEAIGSQSANAARMLVTRALTNLALIMNQPHDE